VKTLYVGSPLLPLKLEGKKVAELLGTTLKSKNWHDFKLATLKLTLTPYFLFNYHYYKEKVENDQKIIETSVDGFLALNGASVKIEKEMEKLIKSNLKESISDAPTIPFDEEETTIEKREQNDVLQFKTAEYFHVPKENVVISSVKKVLIPFYETFVEVQEGTFKIKINAVSGEMIGIEEVPEREKGFMEITKETLDDLKDPKKWLEYTKEMFVETGKYTQKKGKDAIKSIKDSPKQLNKKSKKENTLDKQIENVTSILTSNWFLIILIIAGLFLVWIGLNTL
jgi:hypothetical protein